MLYIKDLYDEMEKAPYHHHDVQEIESSIC